MSIFVGNTIDRAHKHSLPLATQKKLQKPTLSAVFLESSSYALVGHFGTIRIFHRSETTDNRILNYLQISSGDAIVFIYNRPTNFQLFSIIVLRMNLAVCDPSHHGQPQHCLRHICIKGPVWVVSGFLTLPRLADTQILNPYMSLRFSKCVINVYDSQKSTILQLAQSGMSTILKSLQFSNKKHPKSK